MKVIDRLICIYKTYQSKVYTSLLDLTEFKKVGESSGKNSVGICIEVVSFEKFEEIYEKIKEEWVQNSNYLATNPSKYVKEEDIKKFTFKKIAESENQGLVSKVKQNIQEGVKKISKRMKKIF